MVYVWVYCVYPRTLQEGVDQVGSKKEHYESPIVTTKGHTAEPVESGCCLTSCGGSPAGMQADASNSAESRKTLDMLKIE